MKDMTFEYHESHNGWWLFTNDFTSDKEVRIYWKELKFNLRHQKRGKRR